MASAGVRRYGTRVLRRLLLLIALLLALPATARPACHDAGRPQPMPVSAHTMNGQHQAHASARSAHEYDGAGGAHHAAHGASHDCLGCIPPDMLLGARVDRAPAPRATVLRGTPVAFSPGEARAPTPPPPKDA